MEARYNYNRQISPPAPFVHVTISRPDNAGAAAINVPAQLDSAADISVIPADLVERLQLVQLDETAVVGFGGHVSLSPAYLVNLALQPFDSIPVRVLADRDEAFVLLGRDVLNRYRVLLDGPGLTVDLQSS